jgi:uncharacterized membrane protein YjjP (DUF1212 family)
MRLGGGSSPTGGLGLIMISKLRPQILVAILCATIFSMFAAWIGYRMGAIEVLTAIIGGIFGFLGGVSLKVLENE